MRILVVLLLLLASSASAEIYTWKDARGTTFYTNSLHEIPARYRPRAKLLDVATGKKLPIGAVPSGAPAAANLPGNQQTPAQQAPVQQAPVQQAAPQQVPAPQAVQQAPPPPPAPNPVASNPGRMTPAQHSRALMRAQRRAQQRQNGDREE